jgi:hypothetical protein
MVISPVETLKSEETHSFHCDFFELRVTETPLKKKPAGLSTEYKNRSNTEKRAGCGKMVESERTGKIRVRGKNVMITHESY